MGTTRFTVFWAVVRIATALAILAAVVGQLIRTTGRAVEEGHDVILATSNFFSFFTILSNLFAMVTLAVAAIWVLRHLRSDAPTPPLLATVLVAVSTYMVITGVVYNTLLRGITLPQGATVGWSNEILHVWAPLAILLDVLVGPRVRALPWRSLWAVVAFPIVWVVYTLIRGPLTPDPFNDRPTWYPYPFLNPANGGYGSVAIYVVGIAAAIILTGAGVIWVGRRRAADSTLQRKSASRRPASV